MRDPQRIKQVLDTIEKIWVKHPDLRLGQLIQNLVSSKNANYIYYMEDEELIKRLQEDYNEKRG